MAACNNKPAAEKDRDTYVAGEYSFKKITDYLYEVTYDDYEQYRAEADQFFTKYNPKKGGYVVPQEGGFAYVYELK